MKKSFLFVIIIFLLHLTACSAIDQPNNDAIGSGLKEGKEVELQMTINNQEIIVKWENNTSVAALKEIVKTQPLVIETSRYGGFEQVGSLGQSIKSSDQRQTTEIGDIMLYASINITIFFGSNTWSYTKLGHIENLSDAEIKTLLNVTKTTMIIEAIN